MRGRETPAFFAISSMEVFENPKFRKQLRLASKIWIRRFSSSSSSFGLGMRVFLQHLGKTVSSCCYPVKGAVAQQPLEKQNHLCVKRSHVTSPRSAAVCNSC